VNRTQENLEAVPFWLRPRPSQKYMNNISTKYPLSINFFLWPGLRDHLIYEHTLYGCNTEFIRHLFEDIRFRWPYPDREIFDHDATTNIFTISEKFKQSAYDMKNWTMDAKFFQAFPEFRASIPMA
jgi:hypothetical protein